MQFLRRRREACPTRPSVLTLLLPPSEPAFLRSRKAGTFEGSELLSVVALIGA